MEIKILPKDLLNLIANTSFIDNDMKQIISNNNFRIIVKNNKIFTELYNEYSNISSYSDKLEVIKEGSAILSAKLLHDIIRKFDLDSNIYIYQKNKDDLFLYLDYKNSHFKIAILDNQRFNREFDIKEYDKNLDNKFTMNRYIFYNMINKIKSSMSLDELIKNIAGIFMHISCNSQNEFILNLITTDGHRLSIATDKNNHNINKDINYGILLSKNTISIILKLLSIIDDDDIEISFSKIEFKIKSSNFILNSKNLDGNFPNYKSSLIEYEKNITINSKILYSAVSRISSIVNFSDNIIKLSFSKEELTISAILSNGTSGIEKININYNYDEEFNIGLNSLYFLDILSQMESENLILFFKNNLSPLMIKGENEDNFRYILMPSRI